MIELDTFLQRTRIAYFSMEIALRPEMHTYSGGLGVLAGDTARSCADLELPVVFVTLVSRAGYLKQEIDAQGRQTDLEDPWDPAAWATPLGAMVSAPVEGREVWIRSWLYTVICPLGQSVPVLLLDTDVAQNTPADREITHRLYGGDDLYRLKQQVVLGIGGARLLQALGFQIELYHLNEGHAALLALHLLKHLRHPAEDVRPGESLYDPVHVRERCVFTTHTPIDVAHDRYPYDLVRRVLGDYVEQEALKVLAGADRLNMTKLALNLSGYINGVARRHAETTRGIYPGYNIRAVTNGVHVQTWAHPSFARLFQSNFPQWAHEPEVLVRANQLADDAVWSAHLEARLDLVGLVREKAEITLDPDLPIIGFARRMTTYKRPELLFTDVERLATIAARHPFQVVIAGKAHPRDEEGKRRIVAIVERARKLANRVPVVFLPNYDMALAATMVAGCDIWLNTPLRPLEASGTSGMKAAINGVLNLSVLDGWWIEAWIEGVTGWAIGEEGDRMGGIDADAESLYRKLDQAVLPLYYQDRSGWIRMMKQAISLIASYFNSQRMMRRYATEAYIH
jgi:starch phosphorylase